MTPRQRLLGALACYFAIGVAATLTLDGHFRWIVWILLAGLAVKSWIAMRRSELA
jgi:hypothetical protein